MSNMRLKCMFFHEAYVLRSPTHYVGPALAYLIYLASDLMFRFDCNYI